MKNLVLFLILFTSLAGFSQKRMAFIPGNDQTPPFGEHIVVMNHDITANTFEEWKDGAIYYKVNFEGKIKQLKAIKFIEANRDFQGVVREKEGVILLNETLTNYPNLARLKIYQLLGVYFGLTVEDTTRTIMSSIWKMDAESEYYAEMHRFRNNRQERDYFVALEKQSPLPKQQ